MPLASKLLKDDPRLQACLVDDRAHVTPGSMGDFVRLIQLALGAIDRLDISEGDFRGRSYGLSTANAVLAYKKKRKIINTAYQSTEDNIVGKMTIASLDKDLLALESTYLDGGGSSSLAGSRCGCLTPHFRIASDIARPVISAEALRTTMQELFPAGGSGRA